MQRLWIAVAVGCCGIGIGTVAKGQAEHPLTNPVINSTNKAKRAWQIEYDETKAKNADLAVRLVVGAASKDPEGTGAPTRVKFDSATLYRFRVIKKGTGGTKDTYAYPADFDKTHGAEVPLKGSAVVAERRPTSNAHWKKSGTDFVFYGTYFDKNNDLVLVTVRGSHHPGKNNKSAADADRDDDVVTLKIFEKKFSEMKTEWAVQHLSMLLNKKSSQSEIAAFVHQLLAGGSVPCDEAPPADTASEQTIEAPIGMDPDPSLLFTYDPQP